ncbi:unnamed protein product [marine sediment metagenome]|uniref:Uncharacterized protein n=1 Tax=marine sediment metagenome TaxID=412755 RepID=X0TYA8_9ZZZZ
MSRAATATLLIASLLLLAGSTTYAQKKFELEVWTIFASNYESAFGGDLVLVKKHLRKTGYSAFTLLNERKLHARLGDTIMIPIPGGSAFAISPKAYKDKIAYIKVFLTGEDRDYSFYDPSAVVEGTLTGKAFAVQDDSTITLIGPKTRWGALVFIIHQIDM